MTAKKVLLTLMIVSLSLSALAAIFVLIFGEFNFIAVKVLLTTLSIGGFSLTGLCSSMLLEKSRYQTFATVGMTVAFIGFLSVVTSIWAVFAVVWYWKTTLTLIITSATIAHISLLLLINANSTLVTISRSLTILFILIVAGMLIYLAHINFEDFEFILFFTVLGVVAVLDTLGTIITPMLNKMSSS